MRGPDLKRFFDEFNEHGLRAVQSSRIVLAIWSGTVDAKICVEIGAAIVYGKPLIVALKRGEVLPDEVSRYARAFVEYGDIKETRLSDATTRGNRPRHGGIMTDTKQPNFAALDSGAAVDDERVIVAIVCLTRDGGITINWLPDFLAIVDPELKAEVVARLRFHADKLESGETQRHMQKYRNVNTPGADA